MTLQNLPTFRIVAIHEGRIRAAYTESTWMGPEHGAYIIVDMDRFIDGELSNIDATNSTCDFLPDDVSRTKWIQIGATYPRLDGYWGERAKLVLTFNESWQLREFEITNTDDHAHCEICWAKIGNCGEASGAYSPPDHWVCQKCYADYVKTRSIDFVTR